MKWLRLISGPQPVLREKPGMSANKLADYVERWHQIAAPEGAVF